MYLLLLRRLGNYVTSLFRAEALAAKAHRLHGDVVISTSLRGSVLATLLLGIAAGALLWATLASYARTESVPGMLVPKTPLAKIVAARPGVITSLTVHDGDVVTSGQQLGTVRVEQTSDGGSAPGSGSISAIVDQQRFDSEQLTLGTSRMESEARRLKANVAGLETQAQTIRDQLVIAREVTKSAKGLFDKVDKLMAAGWITRPDYEAKRQAWLAAEEQRRSLQRQLADTLTQIDTGSAGLARLPIDTATTQAQLHGAIAQLEQSRAQAEAQRAYVIIAPIAGRVTELQATLGKFADGHVPMMTIVPQGTSLEATVYAPSRAMGFIQPGQVVRLMYDAYPYQRFGSFGGRVVAVDHSILAPGEVDAPIGVKDPVYRVTVALDRQSIRAFGQNIGLQPGLMLNANIILERRSFLDWMLEPLRAVENRT